jgi:hypothetical protein
MDSNAKPNSKPESKNIICKICHQPILESKMFLHEGFCSRNNVFCQHCEGVFLKQDYEDHIKNISKNPTKIKKNTPRKVYQSPEVTKRKTTFEFIEMPMTEQIKINKPIIISNGKIISSKNKNDFILPLFGIRNVRKNNDNNICKELYESKSDYLYPVNLFSDTPTATYFDNLSYPIEMKNGLKNCISMGDLQINQNLLNQIIYNSNYGLYKNNSSILNFNKAKVIPMEETKNNSNLNKQKKNNIIINNNIITYNANNNLNKIHNIFNGNEIEKEEIKPCLTSRINMDKMNDNFGTNSPRTTNTIKFNYTRKSNKRDIFNFIRKFRKNLINNKYYYKFDNRQPYDNKSKNTFQNYHFTSYIFEENLKNMKNEKKDRSPTDNNNVKKCEFCNYCVKDLAKHQQACRLKKGRNILVPIKRDTDILNEKLNESGIDEARIDENKRKILHRQFNANLHKECKTNENLDKISQTFSINNKHINRPEKQKKPKNMKLSNNSPKNRRNGNYRNLATNKNIRLNKKINNGSDFKSPKNKKKFNIQNSTDIKTGISNYSSDKKHNTLNSYNDVKKKINCSNEEIINNINNNFMHGQKNDAKCKF